MDWIELGPEMIKYGLPLLGTALACPGEPHITAMGLLAQVMSKDPTFITPPLVNMWIHHPRIWPKINTLERKLQRDLYLAIIRAIMKNH